MKYRFFLLTVLSLLFAVAAQAQNVRLVRGSVVAESGAPLANAVITAENGEKFSPEKDGSFEIRVSSLCRELTFTADGYMQVKRAIDGMYMLVKMAVDIEAEKRAKAEEEARIKAEKERLAVIEQARRDSLAIAEQARKDSLAALEKARKEAEAQAKAEQLAREKAEQERLAAIEKARKEAEARAKAEEEARIKAEKERLAAIEQARRDSLARVEQARKDSLAALEQARKEAEARAKAEEEARIRAEQERLAAIEQARRDSLAVVERQRKEEAARALAQKKAEAKALRQEKDAAYNEKYRNKGIEQSVDVSYAYPINKCEVYYHYSGRREYGSLHPFELDYTLSYRINRIVSIGAGAGLLFHAKSITIVNDSFSQAYSEFKERRLDVPVFGSLKLTPARKSVRPVIGGSIGYYVLSRTLLWEGDLGAEFRISRRAAAHLLFTVRSTPYPYFSESEGTARYRAAVSPGVKIGFSF